MRPWALAIVVATTASCAGAPVPTSVAALPVPNTSPPAPAVASSPFAASGTTGESRETRLIARMLRRVENARRIHAKKPVPGVLLDRAALIARVKSHVARELPPEAIRNEGLALQLLGFVPTQFDYEAAEYQLLEDQLAGYYEPADGTMYMASDLGDEEAEATLAHELVHALQDQTWDLETRSKYRPGNGDGAEAMSALAEGDATSAMFDVMIARAAPGAGRTAVDLPDDVFAEQIQQGMRQGPGATAPHVMRTSLAAPYIYGTLFIHALRRRGGWDAVDQAWSNAPTTSEQILHVEKWLAHEAPAKVPAPSADALGPGWLVADEDSEGELGARIAFEEWLDPKEAADASAEWGGDRGVLVKNGDRAAFAWHLRYDASTNPKEERAMRTYTLLAHAFEKALGPAKTHDAAFVCYERSERGPLAVARAGLDLVFIAGPANTSHAAEWTSAGGIAPTPVRGHGTSSAHARRLSGNCAHALGRKRLPSGSTGDRLPRELVRTLVQHDAAMPWHVGEVRAPRLYFPLRLCHELAVRLRLPALLQNADRVLAVRVDDTGPRFPRNPFERPEDSRQLGDVVGGLPEVLVTLVHLPVGCHQDDARTRRARVAATGSIGVRNPPPRYPEAHGRHPQTAASPMSVPFQSRQQLRCNSRPRALSPPDRQSGCGPRHDRVAPRRACTESRHGPPPRPTTRHFARGRARALPVASPLSTACGTPTTRQAARCAHTMLCSARMTAKSRPRPLVLIILDGFGERAERDDNAIRLATTPALTDLFRRYPHDLIGTSGPDVGLPPGQMGNSEVGHLNFGAGRIAMMDISRIDNVVHDGTLAKNPVLGEVVGKAKVANGRFHLFGLVSDGGVHSSLSHLSALIDVTRVAGVAPIVHCFLDGRDVQPGTAPKYVAEVERKLATAGGSVGTVAGRYWGMDRDNRWERVERSYRAIVEAKGGHAATAQDGIERSYAAGKTDEFVEPFAVGSYGGVKPGDAGIHFNFRPDRARELTRAR